MLAQPQTTGTKTGDLISYVCLTAMYGYVFRSIHYCVANCSYRNTIGRTSSSRIRREKVKKEKKKEEKKKEEKKK